jgi:hypothetical protein
MKSSHFLSLPRLSLMASPQMSQPRTRARFVLPALDIWFGLSMVLPQEHGFGILPPERARSETGQQ